MADITVATSASGDGSRPWKTDVASTAPSEVNRTVSPVTLPPRIPQTRHGSRRMAGSIFLVLIFSAQEVTEAEQVTRAVDLAAARARQVFGLLRLQRGPYRAGELVHREWSIRRIQLVQHGQALGARVVAQIQNHGAAWTRPRRMASGSA